MGEERSRQVQESNARGWAAGLQRSYGLPADVAELRELLVEAWLSRAPKRLAQAYGDTLP